MRCAAKHLPARHAQRRCLTPAEGLRTPGNWRSGVPERVNYRPRKITEAAAEWFATPDYWKADIAGPFCGSPRLARPRRLTTLGPKSRHRAGVLWQTDLRPRIAPLQSLVGINHYHVRMTAGSGPPIYCAPNAACHAGCARSLATLAHAVHQARRPAGGHRWHQMALVQLRRAAFHLPLLAAGGHLACTSAAGRVVCHATDCAAACRRITSSAQLRRQPQRHPTGIRTAQLPAGVAACPVLPKACSRLAGPGRWWNWPGPARTLPAIRFALMPRIPALSAHNVNSCAIRPSG
jgi:hypothetical protein